MQDDETRNVGRITRPWNARAAEWPLRDAPVGQAREDAAAMFEPDDLARCVLGHRFDRILVAEVIGALHAVEGMVFRGILGNVAERGVDAALRRARMAADGVHF